MRYVLHKSAQAMWCTLYLNAGFGGELMLDPDVDWEKTYKHAATCTHGCFAWDGSDPKMKLWLRPTLKKVAATSSCVRCGRSYDVELEAVSYDLSSTRIVTRVVHSPRPRSRGTADVGHVRPPQMTASPPGLRYKCRGRGERAWNECWVEDYYYG